MRWEESTDSCGGGGGGGRDVGYNPLTISIHHSLGIQGVKVVSEQIPWFQVLVSTAVWTVHLLLNYTLYLTYSKDAAVTEHNRVARRSYTCSAVC